MSKKSAEEKFVELFHSRIEAPIPVEVAEAISIMVRQDLNAELKERGGATKRTMGVRAWLKQKNLWIGEDI